MVDDMTLRLREGFREHAPRQPGEVHVERYW